MKAEDSEIEELNYTPLTHDAKLEFELQRDNEVYKKNVEIGEQISIIFTARNVQNTDQTDFPCKILYTNKYGPKRTFILIGVRICVGKHTRSSEFQNCETRSPYFVFLNTDSVYQNHSTRNLCM